VSIEEIIRAVVREEVAVAVAAVTLPAPPDEWLSTAEAAAVLGISPGQLGNRNGPTTPEHLRVPSYKVGGRRRYRRSEIERYLTEGRS
jgi:hypothetical protein